MYLYMCIYLYIFVLYICKYVPMYIYIYMYGSITPCQHHPMSLWNISQPANANANVLILGPETLAARMA